ncbi:MAG: Alkaline phosphatase synthesis sensor protein PhoR [Planctomycetes bacterium ADurb.Bin401]|nr:MAG: Alkaline phosphatase synthesis sensor protein PhoR [Planctomycetes bacterium ADurb.Bin401]
MLLAIAVILPTVCLLWFMSQAVKNERLAVRQKLLDICHDKINHSKSFFNKNYFLNPDIINIASFLKSPDKILWTKTIQAVVLVYDSNNKQIYPMPYQNEIIDFTDDLHNALKLEKNRDFQQALDKYQEIFDSNSTDGLFSASMGIIRCQDKLKQTNNTVDFLNKLILSDVRNKFSLSQLAMIKVKRVEWATKHKNMLYQDLYPEIKQWYHNGNDFDNYPSEVTVWAMESIINIAHENTISIANEVLEDAESLIQSEKISLDAAEFFSNQSIDDWSQEQYSAFKVNNHILYASKYIVDGKTIFLIRTKEDISGMLNKYLTFLEMKGINKRIVSNIESIVYEDKQIKGKPFVIENFNDYFPKWKLELFFKDSNIFDDASKKQAAIYYWTGILAATLVLSCGAVTIQAIKRQAKLNKLKNDFIATITHELKTPLSSMRVLVDTLLEGRCENRQQENEYLQLISKENLRLSRLIDNFLTFSRMERNKQVFEFSPASPVEIANSAAEAVHAKFEKANVYFNMNAAKSLPMVNADKDAMTTVLINLLDNAYKYSSECKQIELNVFAENSDVCFEVRDNGTGMTRRQMKRIFERFYQADTSLSRRAEGSGLGLSIVKFIVEGAHKGKIQVESKIGQGSRFRITIPSLKSGE